MSSPSSIEMSERLRTDYAWTPRQRDVLRPIAAGKTNSEIGVALGISLDGAKWHVGEILSKLGAHSREEAAVYWRNYNRPLWRMRRTLRGLVLGTGAFKWAAGGVVAASAIAAGIAIIIAVQSPGDDNTRAGLPAVTATAAATSATTATPTATTVAAPGHPLGTTTNDPQLDAVIDALTSGDSARVLPLLEFAPIGCVVEQQGIGSPPQCATGVPDGTPVDVFPSASCPEGAYATRDTIDAFAGALAAPGNRLYSVYRPVPVPDSEPFPQGSVVIVLTGPALGAPPPAYSPRFAGVTNGKIVVTGVGCPTQPVEKYFSGGNVSDYLLPPPGSAATPPFSPASTP